jgi:hypothetical protein
MTIEERKQFLADAAAQLQRWDDLERAESRRDRFDYLNEPVVVIGRRGFITGMAC